TANRRLQETKESLNRKGVEVNLLENGIKQLKEKVEDFENERHRTYDELIHPRNTVHIHHISLLPEDIENLKDYDFGGHCFKEVMEFLDKKAGTQKYIGDYYNRTHDIVGNYKILFAPLLNYKHAFQTRNMFSEQELKYLFDQ
ncbi:MAG: hypothetical protein CVT95_12645, partial [Bacteroidetes bacterium HGW-Bacteroidetes-12]